MPYRQIDDQHSLLPYHWAEDTNGKYLLDYCNINPHQQADGMFYAPTELIGQETKIKDDIVRGKLAQYRDNGLIYWDESINLIWYKNYLLEQSKNPSWFAAVFSKLITRSKELQNMFIHHYNDNHFWEDNHLNPQDLLADAIAKRDKKKRVGRVGDRNIYEGEE